MMYYDPIKKIRDEIRKGPTIGYLAYPFFNNPEKNSEEVRYLALKLMEKYPNLFIIVPHFAVGALVLGEIPDRPSFSAEDNFNAGVMELNILSKVDFFIIGKDLDYHESAGCCWEYIFCRWRQSHGEKILITTARELLEEEKTDRR